MPTPEEMKWRARFPVGLALLGALMIAGGVSAAASLRLVHDRATVVLASVEESPEPGDDEGTVTEPEGDDEGTVTDPEGDDQTTRGGTVERFHEGCAFPGLVVVPEGNWNHGQYVSAWAKTGDREAHREAAHSDCGKPMNAVEKSKKGTLGKHGKGHEKRAAKAKLHKRGGGAGS